MYVLRLQFLTIHHVGAYAIIARNFAENKEKQHSGYTMVIICKTGSEALAMTRLINRYAACVVQWFCTTAGSLPLREKDRLINQ